MSLTLAQRFDTFHRSLVLRPGVKEQAGKRVASIAKLVQSRLGTPHLVGSYARGTALHGLRDVDVLVVLDPRELSSRHTPRQLLEGVKERLAPLDRPLRLQSHSVRAAYDDFDIDFVPALVQGHGMHIPEIDRSNTSPGVWLLTNPLKHGEFAATQDKRLAAKGCPAVRMLKHWRNARSIQLKSLHLEVMVLRGIGKAPSSYADAARAAFEAVAGALDKGTCPDPGVRGAVLDGYLGASQRSQYASTCRNAAGTLAHAIQQDALGHHDEAARLARKVFDTPFPV